MPPAFVRWILVWTGFFFNENRMIEIGYSFWIIRKAEIKKKSIVDRKRQRGRIFTAKLRTIPSCAILWVFSVLVADYECIFQLTQLYFRFTLAAIYGENNFPKQKTRKTLTWDDKTSRKLRNENLFWRLKTVYVRRANWIAIECTNVKNILSIRISFRMVADIWHSNVIRNDGEFLFSNFRRNDAIQFLSRHGEKKNYRK